VPQSVVQCTTEPVSKESGRLRWIIKNWSALPCMQVLLVVVTPLSHELA